MRDTERSVDLDYQVRRLEDRHSQLKRRVEALERRSFLNEREQMEMRHLKKEKLATKDRLRAVRRNLNGGQ
ncbi:MAG: YdcH family protein [Myxococcota bacterium]